MTKETPKNCTCVTCKKQLENLCPVFGTKGLQPLDGTAFVTYGHYGSTMFDPMDGSKLEIVICDECLENISMEHIFEDYKGSYEWRLGETLEYD